MPTNEPELKPKPRGLWIAIAVVVALLALTTWDVVRNADRSSPAALRRAAFDGDEATVRRIITAHPEWIDSVGSHQAGSFTTLVDSGRVFLEPTGPPPYYPPGSGQLFRLLEAHGSTALHHALANSQSRTAMALIEAGANVSATLTNGFPVIAVAIQCGDTNVIAAMQRRGVRLDAVDTLTMLPPLHLAARSHQIKMVNYLLKHGAPINGTNQFGGNGATRGRRILRTSSCSTVGDKWSGPGPHESRWQNCSGRGADEGTAGQGFEGDGNLALGLRSHQRGCR